MTLNLPVRVQITIGILAVFITTLIVGLVSYRSIMHIAAASEDIYSTVADPLLQYGAAGPANSVDLIESINLSHAEKVHASVQADADKALITTGLITGGSLLFSILIVAWIAGSIRKPFVAIKEHAEKMATDEAEKSFVPAGSSESVELAKALNALLDQLQEKIAAQASYQPPPPPPPQDNGAREALDHLQRTIGEVRGAMNELANGNLTIKLNASHNPAADGLVNDFNSVVGKMQDTIADINEAVAQTHVIVQGMRNRSSDLNQTAAKISDQTTEVAAATEEMATSILDNARNASSTAEVSEKIGDVAVRGQRCSRANHCKDQ